MTKRTRNCNSKNHLLVTIFAALLAVLVPQQLAAYDFMVDGLCYNINSDGTRVEVTYQNYSPYSSSYTDLSGDLIIPETVTNNGTTYSVTSIGWNAFRGCSGLTSVSIPNSVTAIDVGAFNGCSGMSSVTIPNSVTTIGDYAFDSCSGLESIKVTSGNRVYDSRNDCNAIIETSTNTLIFGCKKTNIPNSVTTIGGSAFSGCSGLTSVTIPNSVTSIGFAAFKDCSGLESIVIEAGNPRYDSRDNCNAIIETATNILIAGSKNTIIPNSVTTIGYEAFYGCSGLTSVTIPNSVTTIGYEAFYGCSGLTSLAIPNSVTSIGDKAFSGCSGLTDDLVIPNSVTWIRPSTFEGCRGLTSATIGNSVTAIGDNAFYGCSGLLSVSIPNSVEAIGKFAFYGCHNLKKVDIDDIRAWCQLQFDDHTQNEQQSEYDYEGHLVSVSGGYSFIKPSNPLFYAEHLYLNGTEVTNLSIPEGTTSIGDIAFINLKALESVKIPNSLTLVGRHAFDGCTSLSRVEISNLDSWMNITFSSFYENSYSADSYSADSYSYYDNLLYPNHYYNYDNNYANPLRYAHHLYIGDQEVKKVKTCVDTLKYLTFSGGKYIESLIIPSDVERIQRNAFQDCSGLRYIKCYSNTPPTIDSEWGNQYQGEDSFEHFGGSDDAPPFDGCQRDSIVLQVPGKYISNYTNSEWSSVFKRISTLEDINIDGNVDIADVNAVLNVMMGRASNISQEDADVNGDGEVDIFDVNQIICVMLGNGTGPEPVHHKIYTVNGVSFKMVAVEGGTFTMGATPEQGSDALDREKPAHLVTLNSYSIGQTEVTQELWQAVMGSNPSSFTGDLQRPVEEVSWDDCQTFINKLNQLTGQQFRLPTEAEWEYAARGGNRSQGYKYAGSNTVGDVAWYYDNSSALGSSHPDYGTHPVATKAPNELGLYDMSGNVFEWCQDWYDSYSSNAQTSPTGPSTGSLRVRRGGSWRTGYCRVSDRSYNAPSNSYYYLGLRLAL